MTYRRAAAPAIVRRAKQGLSSPGMRADRRASRRVGRQVRLARAAAVVVIALAVGAVGFTTQPPALPRAGAEASGGRGSARTVDLTRAEAIVAHRQAIARPVEGVLSTHAATQAEQLQAAAAAAAARAAKFARRTSVDWDGIAQCETGGNWQMRGSTYSGGLGFANTTWSGFGGREFASNAGLASREAQIVVAERVYARYGLSGWGCRRSG